MNVRFHLGLLFVALLVSCGKSGDNAKSESADASKRGITRAARPLREKAPNRYQELQDALAAAMSMESPEARDQSLATVVRNALELNPEIASKAFEQLSADSAERAEMIRYMAVQLTGKNTDEALAWADSLGSEKEVVAAKEQIALVMVESDPERAAKILLESGIAKRKFDGIAVQILQSWVGVAPADAMVWTFKLPPGESRMAGIQTVVSKWIQTDSKAAFSWVATFDNQAARKDVTRAMSEALLAQPEPIRLSFLANADPAIRGELQQQVDQIIDQAKDESPPDTE